MSFLVFDIETAALPFESLDESQQEYLLRKCETDEEREREKELMSLNPLTARVVCIGMLVVDSPDAEPIGCVYSNCEDDGSGETLADGAVWRRMPEDELMKMWWDVLRKRHYHLISFNGRGFDCPFLMLRSAALHVQPTRNLMDGTRWRYDAHTDLQEKLTWGGFGSSGPQRRFNFDFYCRAFGLTSPKAEGVTGVDVPRLFQEGDHKTIAEYCLRDVKSTWDLYRFWKQYLDM